MKKELSEIKKRALLAKQRMKLGYWQKMLEERDRMITETADSSKLNIASDLRKKEYEIVHKKRGREMIREYQKLNSWLRKRRRKKSRPSTSSGYGKN